ncbi:MAG: sugar ABC transporter permease [Acidimicrobiia bacterium]|nr:sugar ABC transporter permease [Acidimicrobiia bacterium]
MTTAAEPSSTEEQAEPTTAGSDDQASTQEAGGQRGGRSQFVGSDRRVFLAMLLIPTTIHVLIVWIPTVLSIVLSLTKWNGIQFSDLEWASFENYDQIILGAFQQDFFQAILNNVWLLLFLFFGPTLLGMFLAYLLDKSIRGGRIYQSVFYTPVVLSLAVVGFIWQNIMYDQEFGLATWAFGGGENVAWLGNQEFLFDFGGYGLSKNFLAILVAMAWRHTGYIMVLYLAGLKSVDASLKESASLDGCNEWQTFRHVLFPTLKPINVIVVVITVIEALRAFDIVYVLNTPRNTELLSILTTDNLIGEGADNIGRGSAYATMLFLLCIGFVLWYVTNHYRNQEASV